MQQLRKHWWIFALLLFSLPVQHLKQGQPFGLALLNLVIMGLFAVEAAYPERLVRFSLLFLTALLVAILNGVYMSAEGLNVLAAVAQALVIMVLLGGVGELINQSQDRRI